MPVNAIYTYWMLVRPYRHLLVKALGPSCHFPMAEVYRRGVFQRILYADQLVWC